MSETWILIILHQFLFQGMFILKNLFLKRKIKLQIRGKNKEASIATSFFALFIVIALLLSAYDEPIGMIELPPSRIFSVLSAILLLLSLIVAGASLISLKDSWRIGILKEQETTLITSGIYRITRNPYFIAYIFLFLGYTLILQNIILFLIMIWNIVLIDRMIAKEEQYLDSIHGDEYSRYRKAVRRYF